MTFMQQQVQFDSWYLVETECGTEAILSGLIGDDLELWSDDHDSIPPETIDRIGDYIEGNRVYHIEKRIGYGARLSAPGYLDCTEWVIFDTEQEARDYLDETYGDN